MYGNYTNINGMGYQSPYQTNYQNPYTDRLNAMQQQQAPRYEIVRVNGENGADMLPMGARSDILALDQSRNDILLAWYIQTDDAGYKTKTPYILTPIFLFFFEKSLDILKKHCYNIAIKTKRSD